MKTKKIVNMLIPCLMLVLGFSGVHAVTPESLIKEAAARYKSMTSFQETFTQKVNVTSPQGPNVMTAEFNIAIRQPDKLALKLNSKKSAVSVICDGKQLYYYISDMKKYSASDAPDTIEKLVQEVIFAPNLDSGQGIMLLGFFQSDPQAFFTSSATAVDYQGEDVINGVKSHKVAVTLPEIDLTMWFGMESKLLVQSSVDISRVLKKGSPGGSDLKVVIEEIYPGTEITTAIEDDRFVFTVPADAEKVDDLFAPPPNATAMENKEAPAFELAGLKSGETFKLQDYKGKVIMLDFWATWCGPCRTELPKLQEIYEKYKDKEFMFIAVNSREDKEKVGKFVTEQKYAFPVALDKDGKITGLYGIRSFPTLMLINKDGKIAKIHQGYAPGMEKSIAEEIDALLGGK